MNTAGAGHQRRPCSQKSVTKVQLVASSTIDSPGIRPTVAPSYSTSPAFIGRTSMSRRARQVGFVRVVRSRPTITRTGLRPTPNSCRLSCHAAKVQSPTYRVNIGDDQSRRTRLPRDQVGKRARQLLSIDQLPCCPAIAYRPPGCRPLCLPPGHIPARWAIRMTALVYVGYPQRRHSSGR